MRKVFSLLVFLLIPSVIIYSQDEQDTILAPLNFVVNIGLTPQVDSLPIVNSFLVPDSVYKQRLSNLPFDFKMTYNPVVRKYIELYTYRIQDKLKVLIGLSDFYFPIIDNIFKANNIPKMQ